MRAFAPARRGPFLLGKGPKTIFARARPLRGAFAAAPNELAAQLAVLKQCSP